MHPILSKKGLFRTYVAIWLAAGAFAAFLAGLLWQVNWAFAFTFAIPMAVLFGFISLSAYYLCRSFPIGRAGTAQAVLVVSAVSVVSSALWAFSGRVLFWFIGGVILPETPNALPVPVAAVLFGLGIFLYLLSAAVYYLQTESEKAIETERHMMEMRILARDAELRALRAQIDPHFFFNSLNSISAMTMSDPAGARQMTIRMSEFFRMTLQMGSQDFIALREELDLAAAYLDIEMIRFADRMRIVFDRDPATEEIRVPPLMLQPLVENAVKHGIAEIIDEGAIIIRSFLDDSTLHITIENPADEPIAKKNGTNRGIKNTADRIASAYGSSGRLDTSFREGFFRVDVRIPLKRELQ
jgi:two-component system, LytTR family, sensor histidine kinase AlgZ